ncbi:MAG: (d)CMP kinase [Coraliomargaritaceae bacterium]
MSLDGAAATGKSSTAHAVAKALNYLHVDTGAHYRIICYHLNQKSIQAVENPELLNALDSFRIHTLLNKNSVLFGINETQVEPNDLRSYTVNTLVSQFATLKPVRDFLLGYQRSLVDFAQNHHFKGMIVEGRDIGSIVFPNATLKVFLEADANTRIARREKEGHMDVINKRDAIDATRTLSPLTCPKDALNINTSLHSLDEVVSIILKQISE